MKCQAVEGDRSCPNEAEHEIIVECQDTFSNWYTSSGWFKIAVCSQHSGIEAQVRQAQDALSSYPPVGACSHCGRASVVMPHDGSVLVHTIPDTYDLCLGGNN